MAKKKRPLPEKKSNLKLIYAVLAVLVIALAVYFSTMQEKPEGKLPAAGEYIKLNKQSTYEFGKVKMMVFMKFDCNHCYELDRSMPQLLEKYGDKVSVTYVPIAWQRQSTKSIEAYIIAEQMGKGEEMREALFQAKFVRGMDVMESVLAIEGVAEVIGLGVDFNSKLESDYARKAAVENLDLMREYNVQGTPTVVINGNLQVNPAVDNLDAVVASLLG